MTLRVSMRWMAWHEAQAAPYIEPAGALKPGLK